VEGAALVAFALKAPAPWPCSMHRAPAASIPPFGLGSLKFRSQGEETKKTCPGRGKQAVLTKGRTV